MMRKIIYIAIFVLLLKPNLVMAGSTGSEELKNSGSQNSANECF